MSKTGPKTDSGAKEHAGHFKSGDDPRRGHGLPGRSGRKPNAFIQECARAAEQDVLPMCVKYLQEHKLTDDAKAWQWAAEYVTSYGKGRPVQPVDLDATVPHEDALADLE